MCSPPCSFDPSSSSPWVHLNPMCISAENRFSEGLLRVDSHFPRTLNNHLHCYTSLLIANAIEAHCHLDNIIYAQRARIGQVGQPSSQYGTAPPRPHPRVVLELFSVFFVFEPARTRQTAAIEGKFDSLVEHDNSTPWLAPTAGGS